MKSPGRITHLDWSNNKLYPRPDYLSSSRKRLAPQLIYKGGILHSWSKKQAIALHRGFYSTLPQMPTVNKEIADIAWLIYDLVYDTTHQRYDLKLTDTVYTLFQPALDKITLSEPGLLSTFIEHLQGKLDEILDDNNPPDAPTLTDLLES